MGISFFMYGDSLIMWSLLDVKFFNIKMIISYKRMKKRRKKHSYGECRNVREILSFYHMNII